MDQIHPGQRFGDLTIEREIGRGAFGRVFLAKDTVIGRNVALKWVPAGADRKAAAQALREARAVGQLDSPHIVRLFRLHGPREDGSWLFEMEYVPGGSVAALLGHQARLDPREAVRIASGIAKGLAAAHDAGIVHGDVKPGNALLDRDGNVKLADFGLARLLGEASLSNSAAGLAGTPLYMAPEVIAGERPSKASDVWSFGVMLYRLLAGRLPFEGRHLPALFYAIEQNEPSELHASVPVAVRHLVGRCLSKKPAERPGSFARVLASLEGRERELTLAPAPPRTALLGRAREITRLQEHLDRARAGEGGAVLLTGEAGSGKSTLIRHVRRRAAGVGCVCVEAALTPLRGLLRPLLEATRDLLESGLSPASRSQMFDSANTIVRRLLADESTVRLDGRSQTVWALEQLIEGLAREFHLLLVIEDAHHADNEDLKTLEHLIARSPAKGVLVLLACSTESGAQPDSTAAGRLLASRAGIDHIPLGPLSREETYRVLRQLADVGAVAPEIAQRVFDVGRGNPLFTTELYRHLEETGTVRRVGDILEPGPRWSVAGFPERFRELCGARLQGLDETDRSVLDFAAVDGVELDGTLLAAVTGEPVLAVLRRLQRLYREKGVVVIAPKGYKFANTFFRETIYADLAPDLRRLMHLEIARHLETRAGGEPLDPERVGVHWERAAEPERARPFLIQAAHAASRRQELTRAVDLAERAGVTPDTLDPETARTQPELIEALADCYFSLGRLEDGERLLQRAEAAAGDDDVLRLGAFTQRAILGYYGRGIIPEHETELRRAVDVLPDSRPRATAMYMLGIMAKYRGELDTAEAQFTAADTVARAERIDSLHSSSLDQLASVALRRGKLKQASALYADAARIAEHIGRGNNAAISRINGSLAALRAGRIEGVGASLEAAITELDLVGAHNLSAHATAHLARVRYAEGDYDAAVRAAGSATAWLQKAKYLPGLADALFIKAELLAIEGRLEEAASLLGEARAIQKQREAREDLLRIAGLEALHRTWAGDRDGAARVVTEAQSLGCNPGAAGAEFVACVAEACLYGLDHACLDAVAGLAADIGEEDVIGGLTSALVDAVRALRNKDAAAIRRGAEVLRGDRIGLDRLRFTGLGAYLAAEAAALEGDNRAALEAVREGLETAHRSRHVWLELLLASLRARLRPEEEAARLDLVRRQAARIADDDARAVFIAAWS